MSSAPRQPADESADASAEQAASARSAPGDPVEDALARWLDRVDAGEPPDAALDALCDAHPAHADALRRRAALLGDMGVLGADDEHVAADATPPARLGRFRILGPLGGGGMGMVYRAVDEDLGREVALKVVRPDQLFLPGVRARFRREVEIIARLQHPGIVPVYAVGEADGVPYFAMERVRGCSLDHALRAARERARAVERLTGADLAAAVAAASADAGPHGALADDDAAAPVADGDDAPADDWLFAGSWEAACVRVTRQLAEALEHAHRRGVVHRDIKPSNVMLSRDRDGSRARLLDFGLASTRGAQHELTRTGSRLGSLHYMSPEQTRGESDAVGPASDVYALGVTLYEMLTLQRPFAARDEHGVVEAIRAGDAPGVRALVPSLSWEVATVCARAMDRDPARRYPSAEAFARDLGNVLARRPVEARPAPPWLTARRWVQRRPTLAVSLLLGTLLVVGAPLALVAQQRRANAALQQELARTEAQRRRADEQRALAESERAAAQRARDAEAEARRAAEDARRVAEANQALALEAVDRMLTRLAAEELRYLPQLEPVRARLLEDAVALSGELLARAGDDPAARAAAAAAHERRGELLATLGRSDEALEDLRAAQALHAALAEETPDDPGPLARHAASALRRATVLAGVGRADEARAVHEAQDARLAAALERFPDDVELRLVRARNDHLLGHLQAADADLREPATYADAEATWARAVQTLEPLLPPGTEAGPPPQDTAARRRLAALHARLGSVLHDWGQLVLPHAGQHDPPARELLERALEHRRRAVALEPRDADHVLAELATRNNLASLLRHEQRFDDALAMARGALPPVEELVRARPELLQPRLELATLHNQVGLVHDQLGAKADAHEAYERARRELVALVERAPQLAELQEKLGIAELNVGATSLNLGDVDGAREHFAAGVRHQEEAIRLLPDDLGLRHDLRALRVAQFELASQVEDLPAMTLAARRIGEAAPDDWRGHTQSAAHSARVVQRLDEGAGAELTGAERAALRAQAVEQAVRHLRLAVDTGFPALHELAQVSALDPLRGEPAFEGLLDELLPGGP